MEIITKEINGVNCPAEERYIEIKFKHDGTTIDCGVIGHKERIELSEHLSSIVEDLLWGLVE
jgi:glucose-6-phosphate dehydrogenase assembly protein OpcA